MSPNHIDIGDIVSLHIHGSQVTICREGEVLHIPQATGDSWIVKDIFNNELHYVSEGCTITRKVGMNQ